MPQYRFPNSVVIQAQTQTELMEKVRRYALEKYSYTLTDDQVLGGTDNY